MLFWTSEAEHVSTVTVLSFAVTMKQKLNHKKYMVLGSLNTRYKTLIDTIILKPSITFGCSGKTGSLRINRVYVTRISKGNSRTVI